MKPNRSTSDASEGIAGVTLAEPLWQALIVISTAAVLLVSFYCLSHGITIIFMHLFYFPIILLAYHYRYRGFLIATLLALAYVWLVYLFQGGAVDVIIGAWMRFLVFAGVAAVVAYLSEHLSEDQKALQESEKKYRRLFENMLEGFAYCRMIYDDAGMPADWVYLDANTSFERLTGLKNITGKRALEAIPDIRKLTPELFDTYGRVASTGMPETFEIDFLPLSLWLKVSVFSPEKGYFVAVFEDITQRKRAEAALQKSEEKISKDNKFLQQLIETIPNPIFYKDRDGLYRGCNTAFAAYIGFSKEYLVGKSVYDIAPKNLADIYFAQDHKLLDNPGTQIYEAAVRYADGSLHDVIFYKASYTDREGSVDGLVGVIIDISERKRAEKAFIEVNKKLNLLSGITRHDINNQLFSLKAFLELMKESLDDRAMTLEYLIKAERAASAIEHQIVFTKEYQDLGVKAPTWQSVKKCVTNAVTALPVREILILDETGGLTVFADPLFEKVFYNLIDNALRYGGPAMTKIRFSCRESGEGLSILVEDDGAGISAEDKKRLFERGFGHHTGLGLFLSREILSITGISITETGEPGKGARFGILVPGGSYRFEQDDH